jgi:DNA-binding IscR family transcriptional regulator
MIYADLEALVQIGTKFSIAIHILLVSAAYSDSRKVTSDFIASSAHTNPVIIRNIMSSLKAASLINVAPEGILLARKPQDISLLDVFRSVSPCKDGRLFKIHKDTEVRCLVGGNIERVLTHRFAEAQNALEEKLSTMNLQNLLDEMVQGLIEQ